MEGETGADDTGAGVAVAKGWTRRATGKMGVAVGDSGMTVGESEVRGEWRTGRAGRKAGRCIGRGDGATDTTWREREEGWGRG